MGQLDRRRRRPDHLFFLKAPRALQDPGLRDTAAVVGHATSSDLTNWRLHEDAYVAGDAPLGPWDLDAARPFREEPKLFAAPLVQQRDGSWAFVGFRNQEPEGILSFEILDPVPVVLDGGELRQR